MGPQLKRDPLGRDKDMKLVPFARPTGSGVVEDLDLAPEGSAVAAVRSPTSLRILGSGWSVVPPRTPRFPLIRILNADRVVLIDARTQGTEVNAWVLDHQGEVVAAFFAGDAIADARVLRDFIAFTYSDEAYGADGPAGEGVAVFDLMGRFLWGYRSQFGEEAVDTMDVYAACTDERDYLWFFPYTEFPLVRLDVLSREQKLFKAPEILNGSGALSVRDEVAYFANPYQGRGAIFQWLCGAPTAHRVASIDGRVRGLSGGRFLAATRGDWTLVDDLFVAA